MSTQPRDGGMEMNIDTLTPDQLNYLKKQIEDEVDTLSDSFTSLKVALSRFEGSKQTLKDLANTKVGTPLLVPLTTALYVRGTVDNVDNVLVDIGTGYYAEKSTEEGQSYLDRKIAALKESLSLAQKALTNKRNDYQVVMQAFQVKAQQQQQGMLRK